jgi:hypothetical protein
MSEIKRFNIRVAAANRAKSKVLLDRDQAQALANEIWALEEKVKLLTEKLDKKKEQYNELKSRPTVSPMPDVIHVSGGKFR